MGSGPELGGNGYSITRMLCPAINMAWPSSGRQRYAACANKNEAPTAKPRWGPRSSKPDPDQALNELPQPHPPEALGFLNVKPDPIMVVT